MGFADATAKSVKEQIAALRSIWDRFFFSPADALPLSILRILASGMLLYTHLIWGSVLSQFLAEGSWNTPELVTLMRGNAHVPTLWWYVPTEWMATVHWCCNLIIAMAIVGFGGRVTAVATWAIAVSYANRTAVANFGLDQLNCILALYLCIGPAYRYLSVDRWIRRRRSQSVASHDSVSANLALRLIQIHLCVIYVWAGLGKLQGEAWWNGNAMWLAIANQEYQSIDITWLANYPRILEFITHLTIAWEISFSFLVWPKSTRWIILALGAGMHVGIGAFLGMWTFGSIMIFSYISFASGAWLRSLFSTGQLDAKIRHTVADDAAAIAVNALTQSNLAMDQHSEPLDESIAQSDPIQSLDIPYTSDKPPASAVDVTTLQSGSLGLLINASDARGIARGHLAENSQIVVLIAREQRCVQQFIAMNHESNSQWIVVPNLREAESLAKLLPHAKYLLLELCELESDPSLSYVSIRVVARKKHTSTGSANSKRPAPK